MGWAGVEVGGLLECSVLVCKLERAESELLRALENSVCDASREESGLRGREGDPELGVS